MPELSRASVERFTAELFAACELGSTGEPFEAARARSTHLRAALDINPVLTAEFLSGILRGFTRAFVLNGLFTADEYRAMLQDAMPGALAAAGFTLVDDHG